MSDEIKLKPCPFCGAVAQVTRFGTDYIAECTCCDASCASGDTRERAAGMWNSRADASLCNTAALHDALKVASETADELLKWIWNNYQELNCMGGRLKRAIEGAIKKPPRNCDRFGGDKDKLIEACLRERGLLVTENFRDVFADWLLAPSTAQEGGAK